MLIKPLVQTYLISIMLQKLSTTISSFITAKAFKLGLFPSPLSVRTACISNIPVFFSVT